MFAVLTDAELNNKDPSSATPIDYQKRYMHAAVTCYSNDGITDGNIST